MLVCISISLGPSTALVWRIRLFCLLNIKAICWRLLPPQDIPLMCCVFAVHYRACKAPQVQRRDNECTHDPQFSSRGWEYRALTCSAAHGERRARMQIHVRVPSANFDSSYEVHSCFFLHLSSSLLFTYFPLT